MQRQRVLITGGAGFIGINLADRLLRDGHEVVLFDNLSRTGCRLNLQWLGEGHGTNAARLISADVTDAAALRRAAEGVGRIYHLAGQVAVTASIRDPRRDFEDNAVGTFNALEAARCAGADPIFLYASTNKVYGQMDDLAVVEEGTRYRYADLPFGVPETRPVDFHSPYGCSKGAGDLYARDYARIFGVRSIVIRQSCVYGPRQFGVEGQGWLAWLVQAALEESPITIFGDGKQVRDILFLDDLLDLYEAAVTNIETTAGRIYNIGGGPENTVSVWNEFGAILEELCGRTIQVSYGPWRPGEQRVYISDIRKATTQLGWRPRIFAREGIGRLVEWIRANRHLARD